MATPSRSMCCTRSSGSAIVPTAMVIETKAVNSNFKKLIINLSGPDASQGPEIFIRATRASQRPTQLASSALDERPPTKTIAGGLQRVKESKTRRRLIGGRACMRKWETALPHRRRQSCHCSNHCSTTAERTVGKARCVKIL